jgi:YD repeat-containing protein
MRTIPLIGAVLGVVLGKSVGAAETITYTYDAKGRLVTVVRSGTVNNGVTTTYSHDKANNRTAVVKTKP